MNLREKIEEQLLLGGTMSTMEIAKKVVVDKTKTKYFPGEVNTILRGLIKKGKVEVATEKGPKGGKLYKMAPTNTVFPEITSNPIVVERNSEGEPTMSAKLIIFDVTPAQADIRTVQHDEGEGLYKQPEQLNKVEYKAGEFSLGSVTEEAVGTKEQFEEAIPKPIEMPENLEVGTKGELVDVEDTRELYQFEVEVPNPSIIQDETKIMDRTPYEFYKGVEMEVTKLPIIF